MKKIISLVLLSLFVFANVFAEERFYEDDEEFYEELYGEAETLLTSDFSGQNLSYNNFDDVQSFVMDLSYEDRLALYDECSRGIGLYTGLNALVPGLGSIIQGDVYGGVSSIVTCAVGEAIYSVGYALLYVNEIKNLIDNKDLADFNFDAIESKVALGLILTGGGIAIGSYIRSLTRPAAYSKAFNAQLADVLGVSKAEVSLVPCIAPDMKTAGVSLGLALNF